ncbi:hypothetical protein ACFLXA_05735 [Chloroflexota bacterium]
MKQKQIFTASYVLGITLALTAALFMIFDVLPTASRIAILIVGIGLIATAGSIAKDKNSRS